MVENFRIRVFRAVAQHLNSAGPQRNCCSRNALSPQIKALEDEFGVPPFDRGGGHIALTAGGRALLPLAEEMKEFSDVAFAAVAETFGQHAGELAIGASQTIGQYLLPTFATRFRRTHPKVRVTARSGNADKVLEALLAREIQMTLSRELWAESRSRSALRHFVPGVLFCGAFA